MKIKVTFKDPDALFNANEEQAIPGVEADKLKKWLEYSEYVRIEFDTEAMTAKVLERS